MKVNTTKLQDCVTIEPVLFEDERGFFLETFQLKKYSNFIGGDLTFVQDNHSQSYMGCLRGLHFQRNKPQGKLVRVVGGSALDVAVDLRRDSPTFGQWDSFVLSAENKKQAWIPPGFAHGFLATSEIVDFEYKCTDYYDADDEGSIIWNDPDLKIEWPTGINFIISGKDMTASSFKSQFMQ